MKATVKTFYGSTDVTIETATYANNGNLAIQLWCEDGPFATLTVNLSKKCKPNCAFVDINNCPWAEEFISRYSLGIPTGNMQTSGFCCYPEYEFDLDAVNKYTKEELK